MEQPIVLKKPGFFSKHKTEKIVVGVVILVVVVMGVLVLLWYLNVIMPRYHCEGAALCVKNKQGKKDPVGSFKKSKCGSKCDTAGVGYKCNGQKCESCTSGAGCTYTSSNCNNDCATTPYQYKCNGQKCESCTSGPGCTYTSNNCKNECVATLPHYKCNGQTCESCTTGSEGCTYTISNCNNDCAATLPHYKCNGQTCESCTTGSAGCTYTSNNCNNDCAAPSAHYKCDTESGCVADASGQYTDSTCGSKCTLFIIQDTKGAPASCQKKAQATSTSDTTIYYNKDQCTHALDALPYRKCDFSSTTKLYACMKTQNENDFKNTTECDSGCHSFECTNDGCTPCATTGCSINSHHSENSCDKQCSMHFQFSEDGDAAATCVPVPVTTTTAASTRAHMSRAGPFYGKAECMAALNALPTKKCSKDLNCVATIQTADSCGSIDACYKCDDQNCKMVNTPEHGINSAVGFIFPENFFPCSDNHGNGSDSVKTHTLLWMGNYIAKTDGGVITVKPQYILQKPDKNSNGVAIATWMIFSKDYCDHHSDTFPSAMYFSGAGSNPTDINNGNWVTTKEKSNDVGYFINQANYDEKNRNKWGSDAYGSFDYWDYDFTFTKVDSAKEQTFIVFPSQKNKQYNICLYIASNTSDRLGVAPVLANSWGSLTESTWYAGVKATE